MGKKIYNYDKDISQAASNDKVKSCIYNYDGNDFGDDCNSGEGYVEGSTAGIKNNGCDDLYIRYTDSITNKYIYDRWVTTLIFACFIIACDIGLAIFGFLLFKSDTPGI